jgi:hypothetical protein
MLTFLSQSRINQVISFILMSLQIVFLKEFVSRVVHLTDIKLFVLLCYPFIVPEIEIQNTTSQCQPAL